MATGTQLELMVFESGISDSQQNDASPTSDIQVSVLLSLTGGWQYIFCRVIQTRVVHCILQGGHSGYLVIKWPTTYAFGLQYVFLKL